MKSLGEKDDPANVAPKPVKAGRREFALVGRGKVIVAV